MQACRPIGQWSYNHMSGSNMHRVEPKLWKLRIPAEHVQADCNRMDFDETGLHTYHEHLLAICLLSEWPIASYQSAGTTRSTARRRYVCVCQLRRQHLAAPSCCSCVSLWKRYLLHVLRVGSSTSIAASRGPICLQGPLLIIWVRRNWRRPATATLCFELWPRPMSQLCDDESAGTNGDLVWHT